MAMTSAIVIGAGVGMSAMASKKAGSANQQLNNFNAQVNETKADDAIARGLDLEFQHGTNTRRLIGAQKVAFGAGGAEVDDPTGVAANAIADTQYLSTLDTLNIRTNAAREAWGYRTNAEQNIYAGKLAKMEGDVKATSTILNAGSSLLSQRFGFGATKRTV